MAMQSRSAALRLEIESSLASRIPAALSPQAVQAPRLLPIGNEAVNALLGGGLPIGGTCEFTGPTSAGRTSLALSVLSEATEDSACAYIDVSDTLDARSAAAAGVRLKNLLWVRFSEMQVQRPSLRQPAQAHNAEAPSRNRRRITLQFENWIFKLHGSDALASGSRIEHDRSHNEISRWIVRYMLFSQTRGRTAALLLQAHDLFFA
jgi:hypothetical protein